MQPDQYHLCKIAEECTEVAQRALKAQQFGLGEIQPGQPYTNFERLLQEFHDLFTTFDNFVAMMPSEVPGETVPGRDAMNERLAKMNKFLDLSKSLGQVDDSTQI